jgi:hypothetical protein
MRPAVSLKRLALPLAVLGAMLYLNVTNFCQPGWCGEFGFPFTYRHWSDEIPEINGVVYGPGFSARGLAADFAIGLLAVLAAPAVTMMFWRKESDAVV